MVNDSESKDLNSAILKIAKGLPDDKPILLFFGSSKTLPLKKGSTKAPALTKQAKKSQALADCFNDKSFKVQVALKFFNCYDIDVSDVSKEENPLICHDNAPILVIVYKGEILKSVTSCSSGRLYGLLAMALKNNKYDINDVNRKVNKPLREFYDIERKLYFKEAEEKRISKDYAKSSTNAKKTRLDKIQKECSEMAATRNEYKSKFLDILKESVNENVKN